MTYLLNNNIFISRTIMPTNIWDNTITATMITSLLYLYKSFLFTFKSRHQIIITNIILKNISDIFFIRKDSRNILFYFFFFLISQNEGHFGHTRILVSLKLGRATCYDNFGFWMFTFEPPYHLSTLSFCFTGDGASIHYNQVIVILKFFFNSFGFIGVNTASECYDFYHSKFLWMRY